MTEQDVDKLNAAAGSTALLLLLRNVIATVYFHPDRATFRRQMAHLEEAVVGEIQRTKFSNVDEATAYARETASTIVTNTLAAIVHPDDRPGDDRSHTGGDGGE
jgi:hypothetical protein